MKLGAKVDSRTSATLSPEAEALVEASRSRLGSPLDRRDRAVSWVLGGSFLAAALAFALFFPSGRDPSLVTVALFVLVYAAASRVEFEVGSGSSVPTQLVLVPMLFALPASVVPLCVAAGYLLSHMVDRALSRTHPERAVVLLGNSWHAIGPAAVIAVAGEPAASLADWPLYVGALAAQFSLDFASSFTRERLVVGIPARTLAGPMFWVYMVDLMLAPIGLLTALVSAAQPAGILLVVPLIGLLALFARERTARIDHALELSGAYRGTALLLGDVVEADDAYTGSHSRGVVALVLEVADEFQLSQRDRRTAEFAALLHDVGKIRIPNEIIRKEGPLTSSERRLMETHTIEGQLILERVGGLLGEVGTIVRSCHERVDGAGYPDGLGGDEIPLIARIVCACDAFSAMTTDRSYRKAMPVAQALDELRSQAGTQFDAQVVDALTVRVGDLVSVPEIELAA